jgi:hypothetical protein
MSSNPPPPESPVLITQLSLERLREYVAAGLGFLIIFCMLAIGVVAVQNLGSPAQFQGAKDLLLIITPFVGVVIGYYFNKVTADSRAAALQRAADEASKTALSATAETERAQQQAQVAQSQANELRGALSDMVSTAEAAGGGVVSKAPGTLGAEESAVMTDNQIEFRVALERAKRTLNS